MGVVADLVVALPHLLGLDLAGVSAITIRVRRERSNAERAILNVSEWTSTNLRPAALVRPHTAPMTAQSGDFGGKMPPTRFGAPLRVARSSWSAQDAAPSVTERGGTGDR
jgi:hypothetical protein